ncbi:class I SAM-dependent methyltransferase [Deinococcus sp. Marseille-Q6407]|uniref:class I SAM-dependent methyltransferase n=1 Tax=Deinococcus sp. Marseille-Q6407 TaxID=2969223 RepID=UPI0021C17B1A|nr:methyltransferase domain-containing protein [Deinococcus sp. Marseille-Q6407]
MPRATLADCDAIAPGYGSLSFLALSARELVRWAAPRPGERWLDVATGTGEAARSLAAAVGAEGAVLATDLSGAMLASARSPADPPQLRYAQADGAQLPVPDRSQDGVLCAAGLFFLPDMPAGLQEWHRVLRPGGQAVFSSFRGSLMTPLPELWAAQLAPLGLKPPVPPAARIGSLATAAELLTAAGFVDLRLEALDLPLALASPQERWDHIVHGLEGLPLRGLPPETVEQLREAHLAELAPYFAPGAGAGTEEGPAVTFNVPLLLAAGRAPGGQAVAGKPDSSDSEQ